MVIRIRKTLFEACRLWIPEHSDPGFFILHPCLSWMDVKDTRDESFYDVFITVPNTATCLIIDIKNLQLSAGVESMCMTFPVGSQQGSYLSLLGPVGTWRSMYLMVVMVRLVVKVTGNSWLVVSSSIPCEECVCLLR